MHSVSVVLTILNEAGSLNKLLGALMSQSCLPDEIIIVDGGSSDGSLAILQACARAHNNFHYFVDLIGIGTWNGLNCAMDFRIEGTQRIDSN